MKKLRVVQFGMRHEHASGKVITLNLLPDVFEWIGIVDEGEPTTPAFPSSLDFYKDIPHLTEKEAFDAKPDLAFIEVPNYDLVPMAMKCMKHGIPIHMDKPAGIDLKLFKKLLDGCRKKNLPFQMGYMFRGNPALNYCKQLVQEGILGDVFSIDMDMNHNYGGDPYQDYLGSMKGGITFNLTCHMLDYIVSMMGKPDRIVPFQKSTPDVKKGTENSCLTVLEYPHATVCLRATDKMPGCTQTRTLRICGTNGWIRMQPFERFGWGNMTIEMQLENARGTLPKGEHTIKFPTQRDRYETQLMELADIVNGKIPFDTNLYDHDYLVHKLLLESCGINP